MVKRFLPLLLALALFAALASAAVVSSGYMVNDRDLSDFSITELYDLHSALVGAVEDAVEAEHKSTPANKWTWVVNESTHKFHYPYCPSALEIVGKKSIVNCSAQSLVDKGYKPCGRCEPVTQ